jgi:hypothetical protein
VVINMPLLMELVFVGIVVFYRHAAPNGARYRLKSLFAINMPLPGHPGQALRSWIFDKMNICYRYVTPLPSGAGSPELSLD